MGLAEPTVDIFEATVRRSTEDDRGQVLDLVPLFLQDMESSGSGAISDSDTVKQFSDVISNWVLGSMDGVVCVAENPGGEVVGFAAAGKIGGVRTAHGRCAAAFAQYVLPEYRGRGLSGCLDRVVVPALRERGFESMACTVKVENMEAFAAMLRFGFAPDQLVMTRSIF